MRSCSFNVEQLSQLFLCTEVAKRAKQLRQLFYNDLRRKSPQSKYLKAARPLVGGGMANDKKRLRDIIGDPRDFSMVIGAGLAAIDAIVSGAGSVLSTVWSD